MIEIYKDDLVKIYQGDSPSNVKCRDFAEFILVLHKEDEKLENDVNSNPDISSKEFVEYTKNVWIFPQASSKVHPATFPLDLPYRLIKLYTFPGQVILDHFLGIGTTLLAAKELNRHGIGIDISKEYCKISARRLAQEILIK